MANLRTEFEVQCPCCHSTLVVDDALKRVVRHVEPERGDKPELAQAVDILASQKAKRDALFEQSVEAEKSRGDALSRRFEARMILAALEVTRGRRIEAAQRLGIGRNTITRKIQELGLGD